MARRMCSLCPSSTSTGNSALASPPSIMTAAGLTRISNEILTKVVEYVPSSSLPSLAVVSRRFSSLVVPVLYKSVFYGMLSVISKDSAFPYRDCLVYNICSLKDSQP